MAGTQKSAANSSLASTTTASAAPHARARLRMVSRSSPPWPTSTATAMTSPPVCSARYGIATEVSRPPEYASTTRSLMIVISCAMCSCSSVRCWLGPGRAALASSFAPVGQFEERLGDLVSAVRVAGDDEDGVVARDGAEDGRPFGVVDRRRQVLGGPGRGPHHDQVGRRLGRDQQLRGEPGEPSGERLGGAGAGPPDP